MSDRLSFGRVVGLGLAAAGLAAIAGHRPFVGADSADARTSALATAVLTDGADLATSPVAGSLALVVLAAWGVLLVTRGLARRAVALLALVASLALVAAVVAGARSIPDAVRGAIGPGADVQIGLSAWFWVAALAAVISVLSTALAVRLAPGWPEMGSRYDAPVATRSASTDTPDADRPSNPTGAAVAGAGPSDQTGEQRGEQAGEQAGAQTGADPAAQAGESDDDASHRELWKAIGEGRDPTV